MAHHQNRMIRRAERFFLGVSQRFEGVSNDGNGKPAALLQLYRVVDTPRRARPSISESAKNKISLRRQFVKILFGRALLSRKLPPSDDSGNPESFLQ